jgi:hypothetical protein
MPGARCRIGNGASQACHSRHTGNIDDATFLSSDLIRRRTAAKKHAFDIDVHYAIPVFLFQAFEIMLINEISDSRTVDQNVQAAKFGDSLRQHSPHAFVMRHISLIQKALNAQSFTIPPGCMGLLFRARIIDR